jgi:hypothetical protein
MVSFAAPYITGCLTRARDLTAYQIPWPVAKLDIHIPGKAGAGWCCGVPGAGSRVSLGRPLSGAADDQSKRQPFPHFRPLENISPPYLHSSAAPATSTSGLTRVLRIFISRIRSIILNLAANLKRLGSKIALFADPQTSF